jgi:type IV pilus assembly protein PilP
MNAQSMRGRYWGFALTAPALIALGGCAKSDADLRQWVADEKSRPGAPLPPLPVLKTFETFAYKDQARRDPFAPSLTEQQADATATTALPDPHPREKLEEFALDSLKMVGTIGTGTQMFGLIRDPDGIVSRVEPGNHLGQNGGRIKAVNANGIELIEWVANGNGEWLERPASIEIGAAK